MLEARDITYTIGGATLLSDVGVTVRPGRVTVLIGPNGAGKSTLLRLFAGEIKPTRGAILVDGRSLASFSPAELSRRRAVVPQSSVLAFPFTVFEVTMLGITVPGFDVPDDAARKVALEALDSLDMGALAERPYVHLSGGERQRVHLARALCQLAMPARQQGETRCFLLDEPTASLDLAHQTQVLHALRGQADRGQAVLVVLHDLNLASALADDMVLLARTRVAASGPADEVLRDDLLSQAYGCQVLTNRTPQGGRPFVLPPAVFMASGTTGPTMSRSAVNGHNTYLLRDSV